MKILLTTDIYKPMANGVVRSVLNLSEQLKQQGHEVRILTPGEYPRSIYENGVYHMRSANADYMYPGARMVMCFSGDMMDDLYRWHPDVVHSYGELSTWIMARKVSRRCGSAWVHTCHTWYNGDSEYFQSWGKLGKRLFFKAFRWQLSRNDCIIVPSEEMEAVLKNQNINRPIRCVPFGVDLRRFCPGRSEKNIRFLRKKYGIDDKDKVLLYVGGMYKEKNLELLLEHFPEILRSAPDTKLLLVGDGPYRTELEMEAESKGLGSNVRFAGQVPLDVVYDHYALADVFVTASRHNAQGMAPMEAMACGLPVVCRKNVSISRRIVDGVNGFLFEEAKDFAASVLWILDHPSLAEAMGQNARITAEGFSKEQFGREVEKVYMECLDEGKRAAKSHQTA